ncbi:uricase [Clavulina sp. PMI_390]|nr:uricase [Clavulina sp. PMI_390]
MVKLANAIYGKDKVRVFRIVRNGPVHDVAEYNVCALLQGDVETSFTQADNSVVVPTDTVIAKTSPHVLDPVLFALHLGIHFVTTYPHIHKSKVTIESLKWSRIALPGKPEGHNHSFVRDGEEKETVEVWVSESGSGKTNLGATIKAGLKDLLVLKSSGSAFENFHVDEYTTLKPVSDRIFSTAVDTEYTLEIPPSELVTIEGLAKLGETVGYRTIAKNVKAATLETFAIDESASVQATLYKTAEKVLAENKAVVDITYRLPNKHYVPVDMSYFKSQDLENLNPPEKAEVFTPLAAPSGYIEATIARD